MWNNSLVLVLIKTTYYVSIKRIDLSRSNHLSLIIKGGLVSFTNSLVREVKTKIIVIALHSKAEHVVNIAKSKILT